MTTKRYNMDEMNLDESTLYIEPVEDDEGDWVAYADHAAEVARLKRERDEALEELADAHGQATASKLKAPAPPELPEGWTWDDGIACGPDGEQLCVTEPDPGDDDPPPRALAVVGPTIHFDLRAVLAVLSRVGLLHQEDLESDDG